MRRVAPIVLAGGLCLAASLAADYRRSYLDGVRAARQGDWQEVIRRMDEALAAQPTPREWPRLGGAIPHPCLPYYYLGKAHFELSDCERALDAWRESLRHGAVRSQEDLVSVLEEGVRHCEDQTAEDVPPPPVDEPPPPEDEPPQQKEEPAVELVVAPAPPPPAVDPEPAAEEPEAPLPPEPAPSPPPPAPSPPAWLVAAAQAFFDGEPARCLALLEEHPDPQGRTVAFARLFRGAARYALYLRAGEGDDSARELAAADLRECRRHEGAFSPSATYFSPRFIQFYSVVTAD